VAGEEVVQLYIGAPGAAVERAVKELKAFKRVALQPGETQNVTFEVPVKVLAYYDEDAAGWKLEAGSYRLFAGSSSREQDLLRVDFEIGE